MNATKAKRLRKQAEHITLFWVKNLLEPEEADKINVNNLHEHLPEEQYFYAQGQRRLNIMSPRWVYKRLKAGKPIAVS